MARPTQYRVKFDQVAKKICEMGGIDKDVAEALGIQESTVNAWKLKHKSFSEAVKLGKAPLDNRIKAALAHSALGYSHPEIHISIHHGKVIKTPIIKQYPPNVASMRLWLQNRLPDEFRQLTDGGTSDEIAAALAELIEGLPE